MKRLAIYLDVSNLYYCVQEEYHLRLDFTKYIDFTKSMGQIVHKNAFGAYMGDSSDNFMSYLKILDFRLFFREPKRWTNVTGKVKTKLDCDIDIVVQMMRDIDTFDTAVLGSADGDFKPFIEYLKEQGKEVIVIATNISRDLKDTTLCIEIPESLLRAAKGN